VKLTFEGANMREIIDEMRSVIAASHEYRKIAETRSEAPDPVPEATVQEAIAPVDKPVEKPVEKPKERTAKQKENDERLRVAAKAKQAAKSKPKPAPEPEPEQEDVFKEVDPAEAVKTRQKTLEDLQTAYANGHHKEVLELLSRFGNGAKSFRELPVDAFVPIREAIDNGALT
jgi:outer membrane biosynthesis protein TonB